MYRRKHAFCTSVTVMAQRSPFVLALRVRGRAAAVRSLRVCSGVCTSSEEQMSRVRIDTEFIHCLSVCHVLALYVCVVKMNCLFDSWWMSRCWHIQQAPASVAALLTLNKAVQVWLSFFIRHRRCLRLSTDVFSGVGVGCCIVCVLVVSYDEQFPTMLEHIKV